MNVRKAALLILTLALALVYLMSGSGKLANGKTPQGNWDDQFVDWGYPAWARWVVGASEVALAVGLVVPRLRFYAAAGLVGLMVGAFATHLANRQFAAALVPVVLGVLAATLAWFTKPVWVQQRLGHAHAA